MKLHLKKQCCFFLVLLCYGWIQSQPNDSKATKLVDELLLSMGGKDLWANTQSLHLTERLWSNQVSEEIRQEVWRNLKTPATRIHMSSLSFDRTRAWDTIQGWGVLETGKFYKFDVERVKNEVLSWERDLYTICSKLAQQDPEIVAKIKGETSIEIYDSQKGLLCTIELSSSGAPIKWTPKDAELGDSFIYGPLKQFGAYWMPKWWTTDNGHWQFEFVSVSGSFDLPKISFSPSKE
ncbi:hypothetical protein [Spongiimicrobium sp. 3-5]|uniref:hypothetical protein n=1 Tax=Spongiimicrobium sp. 3-5 TaxID=3332596 RepID=UPI00397F03AC